MHDFVCRTNAAVEGEGGQVLKWAFSAQCHHCPFCSNAHSLHASSSKVYQHIKERMCCAALLIIHAGTLLIEIGFDFQVGCVIEY